MCIRDSYYLLSDEGIFCASQYDQIMRHPWAADRPVSPDGLALYLRLGYIPAPYALLAQTHMLPAGAWLRATADGRIEHGTYTDFPSYREPDLRGTEAYEAVEAAVADAVRRQMVSDVPLGAFLSGGIDSPLVAANMRAGGRPVRAYTIGAAGDAADESDDAVAYARQLGLDHVLEQFAPDRALESVSYTHLDVYKRQPWDMLAAGTASALVIFVTGLFYFRRMEVTFADVA